MFNKRARQSGQVALIMVLLLVVVGTIALSVASRSVTDINISKQEQDKIRAFSAAEAGIEDLLSKGISTMVINPTGVTTGIGNLPRPSASPIEYSYQIESVGQENPSTYDTTGPLAIGETIELNLESPPMPITELEIYWTKKHTDEDENPKAQLEISVLEYDGTAYKVTRYAVKGPGGGSDSGFESVGAGGSDYHALKTITINANTKKVRIKALYKAATIHIVSNGQFPVQAYQVKVNATEGGSNAAVEVVQSVGAQAGIFDYALWSGNNISHQP